MCTRSEYDSHSTGDVTSEPASSQATRRPSARAQKRHAPPETETESQSARLIIVPIVVLEERMASLPSTAGPLPLLALGGMLTLGFGGLLTLCRRRR